MDCSDSQITQFSVPPTLNTTGIRVLKLNHNHLNSIPDLSPFTDLESLDLSYNKISFIGPLAFSPIHDSYILTSLSTIFYFLMKLSVETHSKD
ncbi:hypothetical protein EB796_004377 [Bugula neritina]|uniref:Uncharacterized protein n=1 Tax=Bugula neritina TaxID=10212 RepID=A0A7J7KGC6_BUGNE|nr:hypothetical protein EB796_004377 [Bugula neritina]